MENDSVSQQPRWLAEIQKKSWEAELLISSGAIFTLFQFNELLRAQAERAVMIGHAFNGAIFIISVGLRLLMVYFSLHLLTRLFWLSLVFFQKLYPDGINVTALKFSEPFRSWVNNFDYYKRVTDFDRYSTIVFSWAITVSVACFGMAIARFVISLPRVISHDFTTSAAGAPLSLPAFLSTFLFYSLMVFYADTFLHGPLRKIKIVTYVYVPFYIFWNYLALGFLWRPSFQLLFSNLKDKWMGTLIVSLGSPVIFLFTGSSGDYIGVMNERQHETAAIQAVDVDYADKLPADEWTESTIQSYVIKDGYLDVFVPYTIAADPDIDSLKREKKYLSDIFSISVDDSAYNQVKWVGVYKVNRQSGINTIIDITDLSKGLHTLHIKVAADKSDEEIPFWKE